LVQKVLTHRLGRISMRNPIRFLCWADSVKAVYMGFLC